MTTSVISQKGVSAVEQAGRDAAERHADAGPAQQHHAREAVAQRRRSPGACTVPTICDSEEQEAPASAMLRRQCS